MRKKSYLILGCTALMMACALSFFACSQQQSQESSEGPDYIDDRAMNIIASGFEKRADYIASHDDGTSSSLKGAIKTEIDNDAELKSALFEDSKMQEAVLGYLNSLDDQLSVVESNKYESTEYYEEWEKAYDKRSTMMKTLVEDYGLMVGDTYKDSLDDILSNAKGVEKKNAYDKAINRLVKKAEWTKEDDGYGYFTYTAVIKNTSKYDFSNVSITLNLYDADDVKTEGYASANSWKKGDKAKFEAYGYEVDAAKIEAIVNYYEVDD